MPPHTTARTDRYKVPKTAETESVPAVREQHLFGKPAHPNSEVRIEVEAVGNAGSSEAKSES